MPTPYDLNSLAQQFAGLPGGGVGASTGGAISAEAVADLNKALTASDGETDVANLTGGAALGIQSLDRTMKAVIQDNKHFVMFNGLPKSNATNVNDEYTRQNSVGGSLGGSFNGQMQAIRSASGDYSREIGTAKFMMTLRQVSHVANLTNNLAQPLATEERAGALQLMTDAEYACLHGNAAANPLEYDGIIRQIDLAIADGVASSNQIINNDGASLSSVDPFANLQAEIKRFDSWGTLTNAIVSPGVQADMNIGVDPAYRWQPDGQNNPLIGAHVDAIRLSGGRLAIQEDTFLHDGEFPRSKPAELTYAAETTANVGFIPASITGVAAAGTADNTFTADRAGNYYYAVESIGATGRTGVVKSVAIAVAAGEKVTLTITQSAATTETGYAIFRSRQDGTNATDDFRLIKVIAKAGATTTYVDENLDIPGTVTVPCMNMSQTDDAIAWRQFAPMHKIPLPFGVGGVAVHSWFQFLMGYLRVAKPKHHGYIKNVLPSNAKWQPFTAA